MVVIYFGYYGYTLCWLHYGCAHWLYFMVVRSLQLFIAIFPFIGSLDEKKCAWNIRIYVSSWRISPTGFHLIFCHNLDKNYNRNNIMWTVTYCQEAHNGKSSQDSKENTWIWFWVNIHCFVWSIIRHFRITKDKICCKNAILVFFQNFTSLKMGCCPMKSVN